MPRTRSTALHSADEKLSVKEEQFVEGILNGMGPGQASVSAGLVRERGFALIKKDHIVAALNRRREEMKRRFRLTREQCVEGILSAIHDAKLTSDPQAQIAGWREIARMLGHYEPERKIIELSDRKEEAVKQLEELEMEQLMEMAGASAIDGEFTLVEEEPLALPARH